MADETPLIPSGDSDNRAATSASSPYDATYSPTGASNPPQNAGSNGNPNANAAYGAPSDTVYYAQPVDPSYARPVESYYQGTLPTPQYPMTESDRTLRLVAFVFNIISLVGACWLIIPLAWMIPMCVISWGIYKGTRPNTTAFGVCDLIFCSLVGGILLLCTNKDR